MSINIFFALLAAVLTLIFSGNMQLASMASMMVIIFMGVYSFVREFICAGITKDYAFFKKRRAEKVAILLFLFIAIIAVLNFFMPVIHERYGVYRLNHVLQSIPSASIKAAIHNLQQHPNNPEYCSLLFFPSLQDRKLSTLARYLVYYHFEKKYCADFWMFGQNHCSYLENLNSNIGHPVDLKQNIAVCRFAQSDDFQLRLLRQGV